MKITLDGKEIVFDATKPVDVVIEVDGVEEMPVINLSVVGGRLDIHRSRFHREGDISIHFFG